MGRKRSGGTAVTPTPAPQPAVMPAPAPAPAPAFAPAPAPAFAPAPAPAMPGPNVYGQSAAALTQAQNAATGLSNFQPTSMQAATAGPATQMQAPGQIDVGQLSSMDFGAYMNPYVTNVIEAGQSDIERQRQMASNQMGAQAQAAGAFGGSRQAVQEGVLAGEATRQMSDFAAQQRQNAFNTALQSGQFDIGQLQNARTLASQQGMQAGLVNMDVMNQFAQAQAAREQAANAANYGGQFQAAGVRGAAAGQLGGLSQTGFGYGQAIGQQQAQQGALQQAMNQSLIDASRAQYGGFANAPQNALATRMGGVAGANMGQQTQTTRNTPGLLDYLSAGATAAARMP